MIAPGDVSMIYEMQESIANLGEDGFAFFNLHLTEAEMNAIYTFSIQGDGDYNYYSDLDRLQTELPDRSALVGQGDVASIAAIIHRVALQVIEASGKETALVIVRISTPNSHYDVPRWHVDGSYYPGSWLKFAATLIGNPTLFYQMQPEQKSQFDAYMRKSAEIYRQALDSHGEITTSNRDDLLLAERRALCALFTNQLITGKPGEGAFFRVADRNTPAVHSEPKIDGPRLFFSVLPGTEEEIAQYKNRCLELSSQKF